MPPISLMIKPASSLCNLSCEYCFYRDVSEHREHLGFGIMERETAKTLIRKALDFANGNQAAFAFQGGEPTLAGLDFFKYFVRTVKELNTKGIATEPVRLDDYTGKKMTFFHDPDGLALEIHE